MSPRLHRHFYPDNRRDGTTQFYERLRDDLRNVQVDERRVMEGGRIPYGDGFFDAVYSDYVFEHVEDTQLFLGEIRRVLKPGGVLHFRTPNTFHYVGIAARALPHSIHTLVANRARRLAADAHDPYPTFYRLNTSRAIRRQFREAGFQSVDLTMVETEPFYLVFNTVAFLSGVAYERVVNRFDALRWLRANIFGRAIR